jgi:hypothetical protein
MLLLNIINTVKRYVPVARILNCSAGFGAKSLLTIKVSWISMPAAILWWGGVGWSR